MLDELPEDTPIRKYQNLKLYNDDFYIDDIKIELIKNQPWYKRFTRIYNNR